MDGYQRTINLVKRLEEMKTIFTEQETINYQLLEINDEMEKMDLPRSMDSWISSMPELDAKGFTLSSYKKLFKMTKEHADLLEKKNSNLSKLKVIVIDDLIDKIGDLLSKS